jgi:hypothetical protein
MRQRCRWRDGVPCRHTDVPAGTHPTHCGSVPVGLMFFEGAPRLVRSVVTIPGLQPGDPERVVVEAYPGVLARQLIDRDSYKSDSANKQTKSQHERRQTMLDKILSGHIEMSHGLRVQAPKNLADDPSGDQLDALLCAIQAAWAWLMREHSHGMPLGADPLEGWIADPYLLRRATSVKFPGRGEHWLRTPVNRIRNVPIHGGLRVA